MNKFLSAILSLASLTTVFAAHFDQKLNITGRLNDGTLLPRVRAIQTITISGVKYTSEPAVDKNMSHLRRLSDCSVRPSECKKGNAWEL